jgi:hypothetical protein
LEWPALHESLSEVYGQGMSNRRELLHALGVPQIYRGPYGVSHHDAGKVACRLLREEWGGPSCGPVWQAQFMCRAARAYGSKKGGVTDDDVRAILTRFWERVGDEDTKRAGNGLHQVTLLGSTTFFASNPPPPPLLPPMLHVTMSLTSALSVLSPGLALTLTSNPPLTTPLWSTPLFSAPPFYARRPRTPHTHLTSLCPQDLLADHHLKPRADESIDKDDFMQAAFCERVATDPA